MNISSVKVCFVVYTVSFIIDRTIRAIKQQNHHKFFGNSFPKNLSSQSIMKGGGLKMNVAQCHPK